MNAIRDGLTEMHASPKPQPISTVEELGNEQIARTQNSVRDQQIRTLVQRLFFGSARAPARHIGIVSVDTSTATASLCLEVALTLAEERQHDVGLIDAQSGPTPLQTELELRCPHRADAPWAITPNLWMVPRQIWLPDISERRVADRNLVRLREITAEFDFSILWCASVTWLTACIGRSCDGLVLVLSADKTRRVVAAEIKNQLAHAQVPILGTVLADRRFHVPESLYQCL